MNTFRRLKRLLPIDIPDVLIVDAGINSHDLDVVDAEGQDFFIIGRTRDGVDAQLISEGLRCCGTALNFARRFQHSPEKSGI